MGKMIFFITALIFMDILLISTGQLCNVSQCSLGSLIFDAIINVEALKFTQLTQQLFGDTKDLFNSKAGLGALIIGGVVIAGGLLLTTSENRLFIPIAFTLGLMASDFVFLFTLLPPVWNMFIMAPIAISYIIITLEWARGKD